MRATIVPSFEQVLEHARGPVVAVAYSGHYPPGSSGNHEARTMAAYLLYVLVATEAVAVVLDLRNLGYTWGDEINQLALALRDKGGFFRPSAILAAGPTADALRPLLDRHFVFGVAGTRMFQTMPEALDHLVGAISGRSSAAADEGVSAETETAGVPDPPPPAGPVSHWAYAFGCNRSLKDVLSAWNAAGPWRWEMRDSHWYRDYLNTRPLAGVRVRIHEDAPREAAGAPPPDPPAPGTGLLARLRHALRRPLEGLWRYSALLEIEAGSPATRTEVDGALRRLLEEIGAKAVRAIEPYD